jgi:hypothetical protein
MRIEMKRNLPLYPLAMMLVVAADLRAQESGGPAADDPRLAGMRPGAEHEELAKCVGGWTIEVTMGAGPRALVYKGEAENRMIVGGRFLEIEYQAKSASAGETEGVFTIGFDRRHERYALIAMDNFGTYFVTSQGPRDEASGTIRLLGTDDDPMMKAMGYTKEFVHVLDLRGPDEFSIEVRIIDTRTPERREMKYITYAFTR